ncbi:hypothetical protein AB0H71_31095 [Nocardia sp. NPDC050697]|uniref:hypothetical protein n=1 Tax=Nocardia sp. NPDC050697 TaxID=3155158 RepID=UPI0033C93467
MIQPTDDTVRAEHHLTEILGPGLTFRSVPFERGWVCTPLPEEAAAVRFVVDSGSGEVYEYTALGEYEVAADYSAAGEGGREPRGVRIHPVRWRVEYELGNGDDRSARYLVAARSTGRSPEPDEDFELTLDLDTNRYQPAGTAAWQVWVRVVQQHRAEGAWPARGVLEF